MNGTETENQWLEKVQKDTTLLFESKESSLIGKNEQESLSVASGSGKGDLTQSSSGTATSYSLDDIIVEGGSQKVASILSDRNRASFKAEFQDWLESISKYPKGYDFKFGGLTELLDINYRSLLNNEFQPCWMFKGKLYDIEDKRGKSICGGFRCFYNETVKNDHGDEVIQIRKCEFKDEDDFQKQMDRKLLSLKRAIDVYVENGGRSSTEMTIPGGNSQCEKYTATHNIISYGELISGSTYRIKFDLREDIGEEIGKDETMYISFKHENDVDDDINNNDEVKMGRWALDDSDSDTFAGQYSKKVKVDEASKIVLVNGVKFSYEFGKSGNYLQMSESDCKINRERISSMAHRACDETKDLYWINVPLASIYPLQKSDTFYPCNLEWSNANVLMSENSCIRFTATSEGPIYVALAAIPNRPKAMYYVRISPTDVTIYKNSMLMDTKTTRMSAVGLGHSQIFQTYIICSEHTTEANQNKFTRITYGKLEAEETVQADTILKAYLIMKDNDAPIEPTYYAFGSGKDEVHIVDLEQLDLPIIECRGDTISINGDCVQACRISKIAEMSRQTVQVKCYKEDTDEELSNSTIHVREGSYCVAMCPEGEVSYPTRTECQGNSKWSDELKCHKQCDKDDPAITRGKLIINGNEQFRNLSDLTLDCPNKIIFGDLIIKGVKCDIFCGTDDYGLTYNPIGEVECSETSKWMVNSKEVTNVCRSVPCSSIVNIPNGNFQCNGSSPGVNYVSEGIKCTLESCDNKYKKAEPSTVTCSDGEWRHGQSVETLQCIPTDKTCPATLPNVDHASVPTCEDKDKTNDGKYFGGTICKVQCNAVYRPTNDSSSMVQCVNGEWEVKVTCINTCPAQLPTINNGAVACSDEDKAGSGEYLHATSCNVNCQWGYTLSDANAKVKCNNGQWSTTAVCVGPVYFIAGGRGAERDISVYHPTVDNVACSISPPTLNNNWYFHTTFYHDNPSTIHLCGGYNTASTCISHTKDTAGWKTHTLTTPRLTGHSSVVLHNRLYLIGGQDSSYNVVGASSTPLPLTDTPVLTPQHNLDYKGINQCTATIDEDTLVVTGGKYGSSIDYLTTVATYNLNTHTYTQLPPLKQARSQHGCGVLERGSTKWIIVAGGYNSGHLQSTEMLQLGGSEWTPMGNLNVARYLHSMAVTQRGVMVMGGQDASGSYLSSVELLDWDSTGKTWSVVQPSLNKPRFLFGGAVEIPASMFGCAV